MTVKMRKEFELKLTVQPVLLGSGMSEAHEQLEEEVFQYRTQEI